MPKSPTYTFEIDGKQYHFCDDVDLTVSNMRLIQDWFPALGSYSAFRVGYLSGDPVALQCVRWIALSRAGEKPPEPNRMGDFSLGEFMNSWMSDANVPCEHCGGINENGRRLAGRGWNPRAADEEVDPTDLPRAISPPPTPDSSTETPASSEPSISENSPPSVT